LHSHRHKEANMPSDTPVEPQGTPPPVKANGAAPARRRSGGPPDRKSKARPSARDNHATSEPTELHPTVEAAVHKVVHGASNGSAEDEASDLMDETVAPEEAATAQLDDLMAEVLSSPEEYGAQAPTPTGFSIRKPGLDEWFRVHPDFKPDFYLYQPTVKNRRDHVYLVRKAFAPLFGAAAKPVTLRMCVNSQGDAFVWLHPMSDSGLGASWARSRADIAGAAAKNWISITSGDGCYNIKPPIDPSVFDEPKWPSGNFNEWVHRTFPTTIQVNAKDHPAVEYHQGKRKTL
jgi:hypothetical protein